MCVLANKMQNGTSQGSGKSCQIQEGAGRILDWPEVLHRVAGPASATVVVVSWYPAVTLPIRFWLLRCHSDHLHAKATAALSARSHSAEPSSCRSWLQSPSLLRHLRYKWQPVSHPHCLWGFPVHFCLARIVFAWFQLQIH